jgi:hypothetical protein
MAKFVLDHFSESAEFRNEAAVLAERIVDLKTKVKLWGAQTKLEAQSEIKILLTKVDAAYNQIAQLDKSLAEAHKQIKALNAGKQDLVSQMGLMVPVSELHAAKAESSKLRETIDGLRQKLRTTQDEVVQHADTIQVFPHHSLQALIAVKTEFIQHRAW